jgi:hypothetical protein
VKVVGQLQGSTLGEVQLPLHQLSMMPPQHTISRGAEPPLILSLSTTFASIPAISANESEGGVASRSSVLLDWEVSRANVNNTAYPARIFLSESGLQSDQHVVTESCHLFVGPDDLHLLCPFTEIQHEGVRGPWMQSDLQRHQCVLAAFLFLRPTELQSELDCSPKDAYTMEVRFLFSTLSFLRVDRRL